MAEARLHPSFPLCQLAASEITALFNDVEDNEPSPQDVAGLTGQVVFNSCVA